MENQIETLNQIIREKNEEIAILTQTVIELKHKQELVDAENEAFTKFIEELKRDKENG